MTPSERAHDLVRRLSLRAGGGNLPVLSWDPLDERARGRIAADPAWVASYLPSGDRALVVLTRPDVVIMAAGRNGWVTARATPHAAALHGRESTRVSRVLDRTALEGVLIEKPNGQPAVVLYDALCYRGDDVTGLALADRLRVLRQAIEEVRGLADHRSPNFWFGAPLGPARDLRLDREGRAQALIRNLRDPYRISVPLHWYHAEKA